MFKKRTIIFSLICLVIAVILGFFIFNSTNIFFTVLLLGAWILFLLKYFEKRKHYKEYNSPHNTPFFLFGPLLFGFFYNFWSYYTGFLGDNLLGDGFSFFYLSLWGLIFAFPWLLYGLTILRKCFKEYNLVYIYKTRSIIARKFAIGYSIILIIIVILYLIFQAEIVNFLSPVLNPTYSAYPQNYFDILLLVFSIICVYLLIRHGIFGSRRAMPRVSSDYIARRRRQIDQVSSTPARANPTTRSRSTPPTRTIRTSTSSRTSRAKTSSRTVQPSRKPTRVSGTKTKTAKSKAVNYDKYKPKAGVLSIDDFKCIFCFKLPSYPEDKGRKIVLCPKCNYPAHGDEFREWTRKSTICSRCSGDIPLSFRRNPTTISVKKYTEVIGDFKKKGK